MGMGFGFGYGIGFPWYGYGMGYGMPYGGYGYGYPAQSVQPQTYYSDPQYAVQGNSPSTGGQTDYPAVWHYCPSSKGYYPNVKTCPSGWTEIPQYPEGQTPGSWYRCHRPEGYYPHIRHCEGTWETVAPSGRVP
jgi:hypothetical protein